jgi:hypothetical protein
MVIHTLPHDGLIAHLPWNDGVGLVVRVLWLIPVHEPSGYQFDLPGLAGPAPGKAKLQHAEPLRAQQ